MKNKSQFLTFLSALIPGVGYMYLGLIKKGVQILVLFLLIEPILRLVGLDFFINVIRIPFWLYTFFDTFNLAGKLNRGEVVDDSDFIFKKYVDISSDNNKTAIKISEKVHKNGWLIIGWCLVGIGILAILNKLFLNNDIYFEIKNLLSVYFIPVMFVIVGIYMLFRKR